MTGRDLVSDEDTMLRDMKRANRKPLWAALGVVGMCVGAGIFWVANGHRTTTDALHANGYSEVKLQMDGPFAYTFSGTKGAATCSGRYERGFLQTNVIESCSTVSKAPPPRPLKEQIASSIQTKLAAAGFETVSCPEPVLTERALACTAIAASGAKLPVDVTATGEERAWSAWNFGTREAYFDAEVVSAQLEEGLPKELAKKGKRVSGLDVDCGKGVVVTTKNVAACKVKTKDKRALEAKLDLKFGDSGKLDSWTLDGI